MALGPVAIATLILIASSATLNESLDALRRGNLDFCRRWLVGTLVAGSVFLGIQVYEWWEVSEAASALSQAAFTSRGTPPGNHHKRKSAPGVNSPRTSPPAAAMRAPT